MVEVTVPNSGKMTRLPFIVWAAFLLCSGYVSEIIGNPLTQEITNALKEIGRLRLQCEFGEYLDLNTKSCKSCDTFCRDGLNLARCGFECRGYYEAQNFSKKIVKLEIVIKKQAEHSAAKDREQDNKLLSLKTETIVLNVAFAVLTLLGIGAFIYIIRKLRKHPHGQPQQDPLNKEYRKVEGDAAAEDHTILKMPMEPLLETEDGSEVYCRKTTQGDTAWPNLCM